jgi:AcrR family transcriptional regulator
VPAMPAARAQPRRTQQERSETTTAELLAAARGLFAERGYGGTSLSDITAATAVTKGALYHHFSGKRDIFEAVCRMEQRRLTELQTKAFRTRKDPWEGLIAGCTAYLTAASDRAVQQILLLDAPTVLGWEGVRAIEAEIFDMTVAGVKQAMAAKRIPRRAPEPLVELLFGALGAGAAAIGRAEDPAAAQRQVIRELRRILDGLATS